VAMAHIDLKLLGGFQVRPSDGGPPIRVPTRKAQGLLAYLALPCGLAHPRDKLAALLWGDMREGQARTNLRQTLFTLRKALPVIELDGFQLDAANLTLEPAAVDVDVATFEQLVTKGTPEALAEAAAIYHGDLLQGLAVREAPFEEWLMAERERLRELALETLAKLLAQQRAAGATELALQTALRLHALDPLLETVHRTLMRLYAQLGRRDTALRQYQMCVDTLHRELGVEPEEETEQLYQEILRVRLLRSTTAAAPDVRASLRDGVTRHPCSLTPATAKGLVGRAQDLARLREALTEADEGRGQLVALVGEGGIGKTSLLSAFAADALSTQARVLLGRCYESTRILPFGPWVDAVRTGNILADEALLGTLDPTWRAELTRLFPEIPAASLPPSSDNALRLFESMARLLERLAASQLLVLMIEDVHWADEMSLRLLAFMARRIPSWRVLLVVTSRDEDLTDATAARRTMDELSHEPHVTRATLAPLTRPDTVELIRALARGRGEANTPTQLEEQVWTVSEGNPFVAVETTRALLDGALAPESSSMPLPERVRSMIAARLDRLSDPARLLAAVAAVIGREFEFGLLHRASGLDEASAAEGVEELVRCRLLHDVGERFDFTHHRLQAVVYGRLLPPRRKLLHRRVGEALEGLASADPARDPLALGLHFREGEVWDKAVVHLRRAGVRAVERSANREAAACFERALAALAHLPESPSTLEQAFEIHLELRPVLVLLGEVRRALERLREAEALAERTNDDRRRGRVCAFMAYTHSQRGVLDEALASATRALAIADVLGDLRLRILATCFLEQAHYYRGDYTRVLELTADNLEALPAAWVHEYFGSTQPASVYDRHWLVLSLADLGRFAEAAKHEAETIRLAEPTHHAHTIGVAYFAASVLHLLKGDWARARPLIDHWIEVVRAGDVVSLLPWAIAASAWVLAQIGETSKALNRLCEGEQLLERRPEWGVVGNRLWVHHCLGRACLLLGRLDEARHFGDRLVESRSHAGFAAHALQLLGDIAIHPDRFDAESGEAHYRQALALAEPRGMRPLIAHCHLGLGKVRRQTGKCQEAREHLTTAATMYGEMDIRFWLEKAETEIRELA